MMAPRPKPGTMRARQEAPAQESRSYSRQPEAQPQRKTYDPTRAPSGYDQNYWGMAVLFRDLAMKDVNMRAGVPVVYGEIKRIFEWFDLEGGSRAFQKRGDGFVEATFRKVYRDGTGKTLTWVEVGYAIIEEFWSRYWDDDALSWFCDKEVIVQMATVVCERWLSARHRAQRKANPRPAPEPMLFDPAHHKKRVRRTASGS